MCLLSKGFVESRNGKWIWPTIKGALTGVRTEVLFMIACLTVVVVVALNQNK